MSDIEFKVIRGSGMGLNFDDTISLDELIRLIRKELEDFYKQQERE